VLIKQKRLEKGPDPRDGEKKGSIQEREGKGRLTFQEINDMTSDIYGRLSGVPYEENTPLTGQGRKIFETNLVSREKKRKRHLTQEGVRNIRSVVNKRPTKQRAKWGKRTTFKMGAREVG